MTLAALGASAARGALGRTFLLENTAFGIPSLVLVFDVVESEVPEFTSNVTLVPVEDNQPEITDHVQIRNPTLNLIGSISESPIDLSVQIANLAAGALQLATSSQARGNFLDSGLATTAGAVGGDLLAGGSLGSVAGGALDILARNIILSAYERAARFTIVTRRQQFENMIIKKISFPRDRNTGRQTIFNIEFQQIRVVSPIQATVSTVGGDVVVQAVPTQSIGTQTFSAISDSLSSTIDNMPFLSV